MSDGSSDTPEAGLGPGAGDLGQLGQYPRLHIRVTVASDEDVSDVHWAVLPPDAGLQKRLPASGPLYVVWELYVFDIETGLALGSSVSEGKPANASCITGITVGRDQSDEAWPGTPPARIDEPVLGNPYFHSQDMWYTRLDKAPAVTKGSLFKYTLELQVNGQTETKDGDKIEIDPDVRIGPEGP